MALIKCQDGNFLTHEARITTNTTTQIFYINMHSNKYQSVLT